MEKQEESFWLSPTHVTLQPGQDCLKFSLKNTSTRSSRYQLFTGDTQHFRVLNSRTFHLAPGMGKVVKVQHLPSGKCSPHPSILQVADGQGGKQYLHLRCLEENQQEQPKVELERIVNLEKIKTHEEKLLQIPFRNVGRENLKLRASYRIERSLEEKLQFKLLEEQMVVLSGAGKKLRATLKLLKEVEFQIEVVLEFTEEGTRERWEEVVSITGNSLIRSQFVADGSGIRIESLSHELLNGTAVSGSILLVNNYHKPCPFKLLELIQIADYKSYCQRLEEISVKLDIREGSVGEKSSQRINYTLTTTPSEDDRSFTHRYSQLPAKDQANSYKLRNSNFFKKNLQVILKVQFGEDNPSIFKLKAHVVNPAIKISRTSQQGSYDLFQVMNDSGMEVPFRFGSSLYYTAKFPKGKLRPGMNQMEVEWRKESNPAAKTKENMEGLLKCAIKMEIPKNELTLYQPSLLQRPKTALIRSPSASRQNLREKICMRAPSKAGSFGVKNLREVSGEDFTVEPLKYCKGEEFEEEELRLLQVNQNERGNVITNSHKSKNIILFFPDRGYLFLESQHSYLLPYQRKSLKFQFSGRAFQVKSREIQDKQPYKITSKELSFVFSAIQKDFEVVRQVEIHNRSGEFIMVYCLSVDDDYFHSLEQDHKLIIAPKTTAVFKLGFFPKAEIRLKESKIVRTLEFLINNQKEYVHCEGDLLAAEVEVDQKSLNFSNCTYSPQEISRKITVVNRGLNKVNFQISHSDCVKMVPKTALINEKSKQVITLSFSPAKLSKEHHENIIIYFKGSHAVVIPLTITTLEPQIECIERQINFKEGYLSETLTAAVSIVNHNAYECKFNINCEGTGLKTQRNFIISAGQTKRIDFDLLISDVGERIGKLPSNFIELQGYGALKGPTEYRYTGRKTLLQLIPDNPFANLIFSQIQQTKSFKIRNLSQELQSIELLLTPQNRKQCEETIILSCEPIAAQLYPGEEKQFKLLSIRGDSNFMNNQSKFFEYTLALYMKGNKRYRKLDFSVEVPPPQLEISPNDVYFPLTAVGTWSKSSFKVLNKGYKEVLVAIKKPINIAFQFDIKTQNLSNRLTKLNNLMEVSLLYKSKKTVSFSVNLQIQDNFGKKYLVRVHGTTSNSPLLNCERGINSSSKGFSSKEIRSTTSPSLLSSSTLAQCSEQVQNIRFMNRWLSSFLSDFAKDNDNFNNWLKIPRNFIQLLRYLRIDISSKEDCLDSIIQELKKYGLPVHTVRVCELLEGSLDEWSTCLWFILSKELIHDDTLKWVNKLCGINLETYQNAFSHQKKIFNDLLTKLFEPIFKGKIMDLQKILEYLQPSFPVLTKIENKKQFMIAINILYNKFAKVQKEKVIITNLEYDLKIESKSKCKKNYWILGSSSFQPTLGPNCFNSKHTSQKKLLSFNAEGDDTLNIKLKDDLSLAIWNNTLHEPLKIYELEINKKAPHVHSICIQCENKCSQQWKLNFPCEIESQYFFEFSGGMEFKCKMPDLGVIKSGEVMEFRIIYSPTNLKEHSGVLKISNKYQQHVYNLKGKSLRSNYVEIERSIHIPQGQKHQQTFSVVQDAEVCFQHSTYKVTVLGEPCEELKTIEARSNKKEIIVQVVMEFNRVLQEKQVFLQVFNEEMTFCKNIRLIISVIPKPIILQARLKGIIDKATIQKIPITNALPVKQNCYVSLKKIGKEDYDNFSRFLMERQEGNIEVQSGDGEFKLSQVGKIVLKPKEKLNINLSFMPNTLVQSYCQIRIKMEGTENIIVYNFLGVPQLPCTDNPPMILKCEAEQTTMETIKVPNRLREKVTFDVETNLSFIAGPEQITVNGRETFLYSFKVLPLHAGTFEGEIIFKNDKFYLVYPLKVTVVSKKKIRKIRVQSKIRVTSKIQIQLSNKSDKDIEYEVFCKSQYLKVDPIFLLPANSQKALILNYTPLFVGTKTAQLRLYHETMQEISYNLEMISQDHRQSLKFNCELGQKKKVKIPIKNPTSQVAQLYQPKLPKELTYHLSGNEHFPLSIPAYGVIILEFLFTQYKMANEYKYTIELPTDGIGNFNFDLLFVNQTAKKMPETIIHYLQSEKKQVIKKQFCFELLNHFDEALQFQIASQIMEISPSASLFIDTPLKFQLKGYEKRRIRCEVSIVQEKMSNKMIPDNASGRSNEVQPKYNEIAIEAKGFKWTFPIQIVKIYEMKNVLEIVGSSQQLAKARISLKYIKGIKNWVIGDCPNYKENFNLSFISSKEVYLETLFNKPYEYCGYVMFYDEDMSCAEKYGLSIKIGEKKFEKVWITANVGEKGRVQIRLKNGKGHYKVELKNNKMKEFGVSPMQGQFKEKGENIIHFQYAPIQYNGNKKAQVYINSEYGSFNFYLMGKFPPLK